VPVALTLNDVPNDVLAERRGPTRGALFDASYARCHRLPNLDWCLWSA
jgi:hypothetical protein